MNIPEKNGRKQGLNVSIDVLNPYNLFQEVEHIREKINKIRGDLIILDCMGYSLDLKKKLQKITGKPVILPRSLLGMAIGEIL